MENDEKDLIYRVAHAYIEAEAPDELEELEEDFELTFHQLRKVMAAGQQESEQAGNGLRFEAPFVDVTVTAAVTWIATQLVHALVHGPREREMRERLAMIEAQLAEHTRQAERVRKIVAVLKTMMERVERVRDKTTMPPRVTAPAETVPPVDLEIRIKTDHSGGQTSLSFALHSPSGKLDFFETAIRGEPIRNRPEDYQAKLFETLEKLHIGLDTRGARLSSEEVGGDLEALGQDLYHELFPSELKTAYRRIRRQAETVLLVSDEPWIPWEVVKPYDDSDPDDVVDDDFLCCQFQLTRWLAGGRGPAGVIPVATLAAIEAGSPPDLQPLVHSEDERRFVSGLAARHPGIADLSPSETTHPRVTALLREHNLDLVHFVGHGELDAKDLNGSGFWLQDGRTLRPRDLYGGIRTRLRRSRPLVFFNACQVARQSWSLTRLGGWAQRFVHECGCGAFVGPQWTVGDADAHVFATAFYEALERGETFGQATLVARRAVSSAVGRMAFKVYGHPNGRLRLGSDRPETVSSPEPRHQVGNNENEVAFCLPEPEWRSDTSPPGALLRAEYGIVPFHFRDKEMSDLLAWSRAAVRVGVRLYTGPGGMGKTRLAREICFRLREAGWLVGYVNPQRDVEAIWNALSGHAGGRLLIVDYAETRRDLLVSLLRYVHHSNEGPIRVILLARAALEWWEQMKSESEGVGELLAGPATAHFSIWPLALEAGQRAESYRLAGEAFARKLGGSEPAAVPTDLDATLYDRALMLHLRALAAVECVDGDDEDRILDHLLGRERRFWRSMVQARDLPEALANGVSRAMAAITLTGGIRNEGEALELLSKLAIFRGHTGDVLTRTAQLMHDCYPGTTADPEGRWIEPLMPDLLGEHLVMRELEKGSQEILDLVMQKGDEAPK